jgi:4-hydroxy-L-threonine phosphate dehydrogenase PdxA
MSKPIIAITMGDPAGIGPEIVVRAIGEGEVRACCSPVVIGDPKILARAVELVRSRLSIVTVPTAVGAGTNHSTLDVVSAGELPAGALAPGTLDARWGESAAACCRRSVEMAKAGEVSAIVSTPFNKEAFHLAGMTAMDDMVYFQQCFGGPDEAYMVGEVAGLWVTTVTFHVPFRAIADLITVEAVLAKIRGIHQVLKTAKVTPLRIGVAGLNVHSGEGGMFGREEIDVIGPAICRANAEGCDVIGPVPPDSLFPNALRGDYAGLVCMYHDHANTGRKILGRAQPGVTLYKGMPKPVLTVPHGTAYDIAWSGVARHAMLTRAITMAAAIAEGSSGGRQASGMTDNG